MSHDDASGSGIRREFPEMTEEQEISARFAAQMLGGTLSAGPPPPGSMLAWAIAHPGFTGEDLIAEYARRGVDYIALAEGRIEYTEEMERRLSGTDE